MNSTLYEEEKWQKQLNFPHIYCLRLSVLPQQRLQTESASCNLKSHLLSQLLLLTICSWSISILKVISLFAYSFI